jgi:hypothetical protein
VDFNVGVPLRIRITWNIVLLRYRAPATDAPTALGHKEGINEGNGLPQERNNAVFRHLKHSVLSS